MMPPGVHPRPLDARLRSRRCGVRVAASLAALSAASATAVSASISSTLPSERLDRPPVSPSIVGVGVEAEADWAHLRTPETYLGSARGERFTVEVTFLAAGIEAYAFSFG